MTHEAPSCDLCVEWAQHYMTVAFCKGHTLRDAKVQ